MGFVHPVHEGLLKELGVELDGTRPEFKANEKQYSTSVDKFFAAGGWATRAIIGSLGDTRRQTSPARAVMKYLMGASELPR